MMCRVSASGTYPAPGSGQTTADLPAWVVDALRGAGCVFAEDEAAILVEAAGDPLRLAAMVRRRGEGTPLEYIVGWVEFCGLRVGVDEGVFVPRRRSELLVRAACARLADRPNPVVVDLCCGCGAIGLAIAAAVPGVELHAADLDPTAVRCAGHNLAPIAGRVHLGDLFDPLPRQLRGRVDVLVCNAPYVPTGAIALMPPEARDHEPALALDGGADGTDVLRRVTGGAIDWLGVDGVVLVEAGESQLPVVTAAMRSAGLDPDVVTDDDVDGTVVIGRRSRMLGKLPHFGTSPPPVPGASPLHPGAPRDAARLP